MGGWCAEGPAHPPGGGPWSSWRNCTTTWRGAFRGARCCLQARAGPKRKVGGPGARRGGVRPAPAGIEAGGSGRGCPTGQWHRQGGGLRGRGRLGAGTSDQQWPAKVAGAWDGVSYRPDRPRTADNGAVGLAAAPARVDSALRVPCCPCSRVCGACVEACLPGFVNVYKVNKRAARPLSPADQPCSGKGDLSDEDDENEF